jgi:hypothetical protein
LTEDTAISVLVLEAGEENLDDPLIRAFRLPLNGEFF